MSPELAAQARTTSLLQSGDASDGDTIPGLVELVYDELRSMAHRQLERAGVESTLQTTELVHEVYLRLVDESRVTTRGRAYFFAAVAQSMRRVLVDRARRRTASKRGGRHASSPLSLDAVSIPVDEFAQELLDLDAALERLAVLDLRQARVVECRYFGGLSVEATADALGVSPRTVKYDWALARAWLYHALRDPNAR
jgi:RNA polymerase sigma factor (TIGR02999 family)